MGLFSSTIDQEYQSALKASEQNIREFAQRCGLSQDEQQELMQCARGKLDVWREGRNRK